MEILCVIRSWYVTVLRDQRELTQAETYALLTTARKVEAERKAAASGAPNIRLVKNTLPRVSSTNSVFIFNSSLDEF
jgi:hypothetical protein